MLEELPVRPERRERAPAPPPLSAGRALVGAAVALVGLLLGLGGLLLLTGGDDAAAPTRGPASTSVQDPPVPPSDLVTPPSDAVTPGPGIVSGEPAPGNPPLTVLDGSATPGVGQRAVDRLRVSGWDVQDLGALPGGASETTVYYDEGGEDAARRLAEQFGLTRVLPRPEGLPGAGLTVVVVAELA